MSNKLSSKTIAVLMTDGFEEVEYTEPLQALQQEGAKVRVISPKDGKVKAWNKDHWSETYLVDESVTSAKASDYDALLLPGGVMNPDQLRRNTDAVTFVKDFMASGKPIAAICHGPQIFTETGGIAQRKLTSYPSVQTDLKNAGANWVDEEVVVDMGIITSRSPDDLPAFNRKMIEEFCEGKHQSRQTA
jgi:protease I